MAQTTLAPLDVENIIDRLAAGTLTRTIAAELGLKKPTLRDRIKNHPRYAEAIIQQAESLVEKATAEMMDDDLPADTAVIARARARADVAFKYAAARDPANWGQKANLSPVAIQVVIQRDGVASIQSYPQQIDGDLPKKEANLGEDVNNQ